MSISSTLALGCSGPGLWDAVVLKSCPGGWDIREWPGQINQCSVNSICHLLGTQLCTGKVPMLLQKSPGCALESLQLGWEDKTRACRKCRRVSRAWLYSVDCLHHLKPQGLVDTMTWMLSIKDRPVLDYQREHFRWCGGLSQRAAPQVGELVVQVGVGTEGCGAGHDSMTSPQSPGTTACKPISYLNDTHRLNSSIPL